MLTPSPRAAFPALGFASAVLQAALVRELLAVFHGNELFIGVILGAWLAWIGVGALLGSAAFAEKTARRLFSFSILAFAAAPFLQVWLIRDARLLLGFQPGEPGGLLSSISFCALITAPTSLIIGFTFPLGSRLEAARNAARVGMLYALEALGFLAGGLVFTFALAGRVSVAAVLGVSWIVLFMPFLAAARRSTVAMAAVLVVAALPILLRAPVLDRFERASDLRRWEGILPGVPLAESVDTPYQRVHIGGGERQFSVYGNGFYLFSYPDPFDSAKTAHFVMSQHPAPARVLVLGGGRIETACRMLAHPLERLDYVSLDEGLTRALLRHAQPPLRECLKDPRLRLRFNDGRAFTAAAGDKYDLVFVDAGNPSTAALNRFFTHDFFTSIHSILAPGGVLALEIPASENLLFGAAGLQTASLVKTLRRNFHFVAVIPGERHFHFASDSPDAATTDVRTLTERYEKSGVADADFHPAVFTTLAQPLRAAALPKEIQRKKVRSNTDSDPVIYYYNLLLWLKELEAGGADPVGIAAFVEKADRRSGLPVKAALVIVAAGAAMFLRKPARVKKPLNMTRFSTLTVGFSAMTLEIVFIFAFQNLFGVLFQQIGLVTAAFMLGIAAGGLLGAGALRRGVSAAHQVAAAHLLLACAALLPEWFFSGGFSRQTLIFAVLFCGGAAGWFFPAACALSIESGESIQKAAGRIDGLDHVGAAVGAALAGAFLVPVFGAVTTALAAALLNAGAGGIWLARMFLSQRDNRSPSAAGEAR